MSPPINICRPSADRFLLFSGHSMLATRLDGSIGGGSTGLYFHETRFLSHLESCIDGGALDAASANPTSTRSLLAYFLGPAPPEASPCDDGEIAKRGLELQTAFELREMLTVTHRLTNRSLKPRRVRLGWRVAADFADQDRLDCRRQSARELDGGRLLITSTDRDLRHATRVDFEGVAGLRLGDELVECEVTLDPQTPLVIRLQITPIFDPKYAHELPARSPVSVQAWMQECARLQTPVRLAQDAWDRAVDDLCALRLGDGQGEEGFTPAAGAPRYLALFGRDALSAGWQTNLVNPAILRGALSLIGRWTGEVYAPRLDEQPGRVLHQRRLAPRALLGESPFLHYYGDHTASGLWLLGLAAAFAQSGDTAFLAAHRDLALRILAWMDRDGDRNGDGIYEYQTFAGKDGLKNQGWKDSGDAILYPDGRLVPDPIAVCEIQALFAAAKRAIGHALAAAGDGALGPRLISEADALQRRFDERFWMADERYYALALDPDGRQVKTIACNPGACLGYGGVPAERARSVADRLMSDEMFSGWGVRTLSTRHPAFNPLAYHLGSVWPWPNALAAKGFARYGLTDHLHRLVRAMLESARLFEFNRMPELFGGHGRHDHAHPGLYPEACSPQAWSAAGVISLFTSMAGLRPAAPLGVVFVEPALPDWLPEFSFARLPVGKGRLSLRFWRDDAGHSRFDVEANSSGCRVLSMADSAGFSRTELRAADFAAAVA